MEDGLRDIKPIEVPWLTPEQAAILAALLLGALAIYLWLRQRKMKHLKKPMVQPEEKLSPREWAFRHLDRLKQETTLGFVVDHEEIRKKFYFSISEILRQYLERQFHIPAAERTTEELLPEIKNLGSSKKISAAHLDVIGRFLRETDLIKFTDQVPSATDPKEKWQAVWNLVGETSRLEEVK